MKRYAPESIHNDDSASFATRALRAEAIWSNNQPAMADDLSNELNINIPLFELIQTLRQELKAAVEVARADNFKLDLQEVELTLELVIKRESSANGKVELLVAKAGADTRRGTEQTHTLKLKLKPAGANRILVSGESTDAQE